MTSSMNRRGALRALGGSALGALGGGTLGALGGSALGALGGMSIASRAFAQEAWPAKPVRIIVPSSPGGGTDLYARLLAQALGDAFKQQFVVENRPGASGNIGAAAAAKAPADGYTLLVSANPALTINPNLYKNLPYDAERDFVPITRVMAPVVIIVHPSTRARTFAELIELGKREPGKISYGSAGTGSPTYLSVRLLEERTGARFLHAPYKGVGPAYQDLLGGNLQFLFPDIASALPHIRGGKVIPIVVDQRTPLLPNVPTLADAGFNDFWTGSAFALVAPAATPPAVVERLNREIASINRSAAFTAKLESQALVPMIETPAALADAFRKERENYAAFIRRNGIEASD